MSGSDARKLIENVFQSRQLGRTKQYIKKDNKMLLAKNEKIVLSDESLTVVRWRVVERLKKISSIDQTVRKNGFKNSPK